MYQQTIIKNSQQFYDRTFSRTAKKLNDDNALIEYCINKAWQDATIRERYNKASEIIKNKTNIQQKLKIELSGDLSTLINNFDNWHQTLCENKDYGMRCGVWQKLINMTFKYIYVANKCKNLLNKFEPIFPYLHCPVDSIIAKSVLENITNNELEIDEECLNIISSISKSGEINFNNLNYKQYLIFQSAVKKLAKALNLSNLEYDILMWRTKSGKI